MADEDPTPRDPVTKHPQPEFPQQDQSPPGWTGPMDPPPDHGEDSYRGSGLLEGRKRCSPEAIPALAGPLRWRSREKART